MQQELYSTDGNTVSRIKTCSGLSQGKAYVKGYEIEKHGTTFIDVDKARDFETESGEVTRFEQLFCKYYTVTRHS